MSEPKRYTLSGLHPHIIESKDGFMVYYEDYARLKAEVERLEAFATRTIIPNEILQAQVERLTKAGDAMAFHYQELVRIEWGSMTTHIAPSIVRWNAAKEGKQS
jgi:hypothetical protein